MHQYSQHLERMQKQFNEKVDGLANQQRTLEQALHTAFSAIMPSDNENGNGGSTSARTGRSFGGGGGGNAQVRTSISAGGRDRVLGRLSVAFPSGGGGLLPEAER